MKKKDKVKRNFNTKMACFSAIMEVVSLIVTAFCAPYFGAYFARENPFDVTETVYGDEIAVMNFNVRCVAVDDVGKKSWFYRADSVIDQIRAAHPDIITCQEVTPVHLSYFKRNLSGYDYEIKYRDNFGVMSEGTPVFYRKDRFEKVDTGSFWLSETPSEMSKGWGAACYRICSYVILKDLRSGKEFIVFNTHLDHVSEEARINGIGLVLSKIAEFGGRPSILTGDMNDYEGSQTYLKAVENFDDSRKVAAVSDEGFTYHGWGKVKSGESPIDFCFVSKGDFTVNSYKILDEKVNGIYTSDHYPLLVKFELSE